MAQTPPFSGGVLPGLDTVVPCDETLSSFGWNGRSGMFASAGREGGGGSGRPIACPLHSVGCWKQCTGTHAYTMDQTLSCAHSWHCPY